MEGIDPALVAAVKLKRIAVTVDSSTVRAWRYPDGAPSAEVLDFELWEGQLVDPRGGQ